MTVVRSVRKETKSISLKLSDLHRGEYLLYNLKVQGSQGIFSIVDEKSRVLLKNTDFPNPQQDYSYKWPKTSSDIPPEKDIIYTLAMFFTQASKYTYTVECFKADGSKPITLKDIDFTSENAADSDYNTLRLLFT